MTDPRIRSVEWRDLLKLTPVEVVREAVLWVPWVALTLVCAHYCQQYPTLVVPALAAAFVFFLTGLRVVHNAYHYALGLPKWATEWTMVVLSTLMLGSMHAVKVNHLRHHKHCMDDEDVEAMSARMPGWKAILFGPVFPVMIHYTAFKVGSKSDRRWIGFELLLNAAMITLAFGVFDIFALKFHLVVMAVGQCFTAFFAVWTVHHDCDRSHYIARTQRGRFKNFFTHNMFLHTEHHLFPRVPTCHLSQLADRLDAQAPELRNVQVF